LFNKKEKVQTANIDKQTDKGKTMTGLQ